MRSRWFGIVIAAFAAGVSVWACPHLPPAMATHWSLSGTPDRFSSRLMAVSIMPVLLVFMTVLFNVLPKVDPRRENYAKFLSSYWLIANAVILFLLLAHALIIASGLGYGVRIDRLMPLGVGLLFVFLGNYTSLFWPLIMIKSDYLRTLPIGMLYFDTVYGKQTNLLMAASVMNVVPLIVLFVFTQKFLVKGIQLGAVKG